MLTYKSRVDHNDLTLMDSIGQRPMTFHRQDVLRILYDNLSETDRRKVHTGKKVVDVQTHSTGVTVSCADGSSYEGSIVIGADGVYSKTRGFMRKLALAASPDSKAVNPEKPYTAHFKCMWGTVPIPRDLSPGDHTDCHTDDGVSAMFLTGRDKGWFFMFGLLDAPTQERRDYTDKDMEEFAEKLADMHISPSVNFREVWASRYSAGMSNLDEGVLDHWSWDRVVLMGDAVHKVTPNAGWGLNSGIQDVAVLVSDLRQLLADRADQPTTEQLTSIFHEYQKKRMENMKDVFNFSAAQTRQSARDRTWTGLLYRVVETLTLMIPKFDWLMLRYKSSKLLSAGYALDFLHGKEPFSGLVGWKHPIRNA